VTIKLNPEQDAARQYIEGPLLVLAGAGSGKTGVITRKIAHLIKDLGFLPEKIAAITFTNKAAREMRQRVSGLLKGVDAKGLRVCTFHSMGLQILHQECKQLGFRPGFSIFDAHDSQSLVRELLPAGAQKDTINSVCWTISRWKSATLSIQDAAEKATGQAEQLAAEVYAEYQDKLQHFNAFDFDDLIMQPVCLLAADETTRLRWQQRLRYILVDEYQDTNASQYQLLRLLLGERGALTAVGDDDQSIYGWRGAQPENLSLLGEDFPTLKVIKLEQNYRSSRTILDSANHLIRNNPHTIEKKLWSDLGHGDPIRVLVCENAENEAEKVTAELIHRRIKSRCKHGDFAILYRSNHQSRVIEQTLRSHRVPYIISGGQSFFDRSEVKDVLSYLRLLANPNDDSAFLRVINTPRRGIGAGSVETIADFAAHQRSSMLAAVQKEACIARLNSRTALTVKRFADWVTRLHQRAQHGDPIEVVLKVLDDTDYLQWLKTQGKNDLQTERRIRAIEDLLSWLRKLSADSEPGATLVDLIQQLALMGNDDEDEADDDSVRLMTLHAAKGLEFPHVFMIGVEEDVLPHRNSLDEGSVEEERRLMYVGITRAQRTLCLSYADQRRRFGETLRAKPSRFLEELPESLLIWQGRDEEKDAAETKQRAQSHLQGLRELLAD
jgi:ATP-dependent DNA helicase Rep